MKYGVFLGALFGVALSIWLLETFGLARVVDLLKMAGWIGVATLVAVHVAQMGFSTLGWAAIARPTGLTIRLRTFFLLRWVREGVNNLLPFAQVGGEVVAPRLLHQRGFRLAPVIAATVADFSLEVVSQAVFTLIGVYLLVRSAVDATLVHSVMAGLAVASISIAALLLALRFGLAGIAERTLLRLGRSLKWPKSADIEGLNAALLGCLRAPRALALSTAWHLASWLLGGVEVSVALHFLGHDVTLVQGLVIESVGQALKSVGFAVPAALGVQEGGYIVICQTYGLAPEVGIALSLLKRFREVILGIPALVYWILAERWHGRLIAVRSVLP